MKAVVLTAFGSADKLLMQERPVPEIGPGDLLVKVYATSVNPADLGLRTGMFGAMIKPPLLLGFDVAGVVEKVGANVETFSEGDEVYYAVELTDPRGGANAEYHAVAASAVTPKPQNLSFEESAAVPVAGGTAYAALMTAADLRLGQSVRNHSRSPSGIIRGRRLPNRRFLRVGLFHRRFLRIGVADGGRLARVFGRTWWNVRVGDARVFGNDKREHRGSFQLGWARVSRSANNVAKTTSQKQCCSRSRQV